jgi:death on curing protein
VISWISKQEVLAIHSQLLAVFGGPRGVRDEGLLESALAHPQNYAAYTKTPSFYRLAATYAFGITRNYPFIDANKRTAMIVSFVFIEMNRIEVTASQEEAYFAFYDLAAGKITEEQLTIWFEEHSTPQKK